MTVLDYNSVCVDCDQGRDPKCVLEVCQHLFHIEGKTSWGGKKRKILGGREEAEIFQQLHKRN